MFNSIGQLISLPSDEVYRVGDGGPDHAVVPHLYSLMVMQFKVLLYMRSCPCSFKITYDLILDRKREGVTHFFREILVCLMKQSDPLPDNMWVLSVVCRIVSRYKRNDSIVHLELHCPLVISVFFPVTIFFF